MTTYVKIQFLANSAVARVFVAAVLFVCLVRACGTDQGSEQARVFVAAVLFVCLVRACGTDQSSEQARVFVAAVLFVCLVRACGTDQGSEQAVDTLFCLFALFVHVCTDQVRACGTDQGSEQAVDLQRSFFLGVGVKVNCCPVLSTSL